MSSISPPNNKNAHYCCLTIKLLFQKSNGWGWTVKRKLPSSEWRLSTDDWSNTFDLRFRDSPHRNQDTQPHLLPRSLSYPYLCLTSRDYLIHTEKYSPPPLSPFPTSHFYILYIFVIVVYIYNVYVCTLNI